MEEDKVLLQITKENEGISVHVHVENTEDVFHICVALRQIIKNNRAIAAGFGAVEDLARAFPEFDDVINGSAVEMPDFDRILKS